MKGIHSCAAKGGGRERTENIQDIQKEGRHHASEQEKRGGMYGNRRKCVYPAWKKWKHPMKETEN